MFHVFNVDAGVGHADDHGPAAGVGFQRLLQDAELVVGRDAGVRHGGNGENHVLIAEVVVFIAGLRKDGEIMQDQTGVDRPVLGGGVFDRDDDGAFAAELRRDPLIVPMFLDEIRRVDKSIPSFGAEIYILPGSDFFHGITSVKYGK